MTGDDSIFIFYLRVQYTKGSLSMCSIQLGPFLLLWVSLKARKEHREQKRQGLFYQVESSARSACSVHVPAAAAATAGSAGPTDPW